MEPSDAAPSAPVMPCLPPGGLFEIVFSFDTTGSMSRVADEVKGRLQDMIQRLQADIPGIRIGLIAHGDYCDKEVFYLEKHIDFSNNIVEMCDFLKDVEGTGGGDPEECYEYVLRMTSEFSWTPGSQRALVVIGDATPHEADYDLNVDNLDWRKEAENLANMGIKIYGVQAFEEEDSTRFFQELVELTAGHHVKLGDFSHICDFIMAICYREKGEDFLMDYEAEVRAREGRKKLANDLEGLFGVLRRGDSSVSNASGPGPSNLRKSASNISSLSDRPVDLRKAGSSASVNSCLRKGRVVGRKRRLGSTSTRSPSSSMSRSRSPLSRSGSPRSRSGSPRSPQRSHSGSRSRSGSPSCSVSSSSSVGNPAKGKNMLAKKKGKSVKPITDMTPRHKVPDTKFILKQNGLGKRWSQWKLAITSEAPKSDRVWAKRDKTDRKSGKKLCTGWRKRTLFAKEGGKTRVLYEIATQRKAGAKMNVVFSKWGLVGANPENWEQRILGQKRLRNIVEEVLSNNWKVFIRRFVAKGLGKNQRQSVRLFKRQYRYEWATKDVN